MESCVNGAYMMSCNVNIKPNAQISGFHLNNVNHNPHNTNIDSFISKHLDKIPLINIMKESFTYSLLLPISSL